MYGVRRPNPQSYQLRQVNALESRNYELVATTKAKHRSAPDAECENVRMCLPPNLQSRDLWSLGKGSTKRVMDIVFNVSIASFVWRSLVRCLPLRRGLPPSFNCFILQCPASGVLLHTELQGWSIFDGISRLLTTGLRKQDKRTTTTSITWCRRA